MPAWVQSTIVMVGSAVVVLILLVLEHLQSKRIKHSDSLLANYSPAGPPSSDPSAAERYWSYYELQYTRVAAHESGRLQFSSFVTAGSIVAIGLLADDRSANSWAAGAAGIAVILANSFAIAYSTNSRYWVKLHQARASQILKALSTDGLQAIQDKVETDYKTKRSGKRHSPQRSNLIISYLHALVAMAAASLLAFS